MIQLSAVAIRLFSIGLFVYALTTVVSLISIVSYSETVPIISYIIPASLFLIAILLWFFPFSALANLTRGFQIDLDKERDYSFDEVANFLIVILGLYFLYHAISDVVYWALLLQFTASSNLPGVEISADQKANIGATVIEAIMAFYLIMGRRGILKLLKIVRTGGT